jgi:non-haem Fe2+, alpha-ketoglutarate-dependent halogenase
MSLGLTHAELQRYDRDGVVFPLCVLSQAEITSRLAEVRTTAEHFGNPLYRIDHCHLFFRWAFEIVTNSTVLDAVASLLGNELLVHSGRLMWKPAHDPSFVSWHQDGAHTSGAEGYMTTAWIALSSSTAENGCLQVVAGSHREVMYPHQVIDRSNGQLNNAEVCDLSPPADKILNVSLRPGEMSLHHNRALHGSLANQSDNDRIGLSVTYVTPAMRNCSYPMLRARGECATEGLRIFEPPPPNAISTHQVAQHQSFIRAEAARKENRHR